AGCQTQLARGSGGEVSGVVPGELGMRSRQLLQPCVVGKGAVAHALIGYEPHREATVFRRHLLQWKIPDRSHHRSERAVGHDSLAQALAPERFEIFLRTAGAAPVLAPKPV